MQGTLEFLFVLGSLPLFVEHKILTSFFTSFKNLGNIIEVCMSAVYLCCASALKLYTAQRPPLKSAMHLLFRVVKTVSKSIWQWHICKERNLTMVEKELQLKGKFEDIPSNPLEQRAVNPNPQSCPFSLQLGDKKLAPGQIPHRHHLQDLTQPRWEQCWWMLF